MKSRIDWNEIVPRLDVGLQQTLYLEAVRLVTNGARPAAKPKRTNRKWSARQKAQAIKYYKSHGHSETIRRYGISSGLLHRWKEVAKT